MTDNVRIKAILDAFSPFAPKSTASPYVVEAAKRAAAIKSAPKFTWRHALLQDGKEVGVIEKVYRDLEIWNTTEVFYAWTYTDAKGHRTGADERTLEDAMFELKNCAMERL